VCSWASKQVVNLKRLSGFIVQNKKEQINFKILKNWVKTTCMPGALYEQTELEANKQWGTNKISKSSPG